MERERNKGSQVAECLHFRSSTDKLYDIWQVNVPLIYKLNLGPRSILMIKLGDVGDIILQIIKPYVI